MAVSTIKQPMMDMTKRFLTITGTTPDATGIEKNYALPQGFSSFNSVVVGYTLQFSNNTWYANAPEAKVQLDSQNLRLSVSIAGYTTRPFKALVIKL